MALIPPANTLALNPYARPARHDETWRNSSRRGFIDDRPPASPGGGRDLYAAPDGQGFTYAKTTAGIGVSLVETGAMLPRSKVRRIGTALRPPGNPSNVQPMQPQSRT